METLNRLVSESLARHGFERPVDYRRLQWSRWFRCESHHSLLQIPSKPGVFALAEEIGTGVPEAGSRMLAVTQFFEYDDMAFVLDRMLTWKNPMRTRLASGRYFIRYVVLEEESQRRSICSALNQWIADSTEKATGIGAHFATSLLLTDTTHGATGASPVPRGEASGPGKPAGTTPNPSPELPPMQPAATNIHCPSQLPSGF